VEEKLQVKSPFTFLSLIMNKYDALMYYLLNRLLMNFGMRYRANEKEDVVYMYRINNYALGKNSMHVVKLSDNVADAFRFLKLDYEDYKKQDFKYILEFVDYFTTRCPYLTRSIVNSIEKEIRTTVERTDTINQIDKFVKSLKLGHVVLGDFDFLPVMMYQNLRESIIRNFFDEEKVHEQFITIKLQHLREVELVNKFSPKKLVTWVTELETDSALAGIFSTMFVNYITHNEWKKFPRYLVDNDVNIIKKEVLNFYGYQFLNSEVYRNYCLKKATKE
jgi:hypothetical protein